MVKPWITHEFYPWIGYSSPYFTRFTVRPERRRKPNSSWWVLPAFSPGAAAGTGETLGVDDWLKNHSQMWTWQFWNALGWWGETISLDSEFLRFHAWTLKVETVMARQGGLVHHLCHLADVPKVLALAMKQQLPGLDFNASFPHWSCQEVCMYCCAGEGALPVGFASQKSWRVCEQKFTMKNLMWKIDKYWDTMCKMATLMYSSKTLPPFIIPCPEACVFSSFPASLDTQVAKHEEAHRPVCGGSASCQCGDREGCVGSWTFGHLAALICCDVGAYMKPQINGLV